MHRQHLRARLLVAPAVALFVTACGGGDTTVASGSPSSASADASALGGSSPEDIAEANIELLESAADARDQDVLIVDDGSIASLREAVDGDRPVLLWFWAPH